LEYCLLALAGVGFVLLVLLVHPLATLLMVGSVASVLLFLFGEMWIFNIRLNDVSLVNMVRVLRAVRHRRGIAVDRMHLSYLAWAIGHLYPA
jgi:multidrug efflux pump subunit AcrB